MGSNLKLFLSTHFKHLFHFYHYCNFSMFSRDISKIEDWLEIALKYFGQKCFIHFALKQYLAILKIYICRLIFALEFQFNTRKVMQKQKHAT